MVFPTPGGGQQPEPALQQVTGILLAGGRARRMGGADKGLIDLAGRPLVSYVLGRLRPQVDTVLISANRHRDAYGAHGVRVIADDTGDFAGPLAGVLAGMTVADTPFVVTMPCDAPFAPADLVARLRQGLSGSGAALAVAHDGARRQPMFLLARTALAADLRAWLGGGGRQVEAWIDRCRGVDVDFGDVASDGACGAFGNINTPAERDEAAARLTGGGQPT